MCAVLREFISSGILILGPREIHYGTPFQGIEPVEYKESAKSNIYMQASSSLICAGSTSSLIEALERKLCGQRGA